MSAVDDDFDDLADLFEEDEEEDLLEDLDDGEEEEEWEDDAVSLVPVKPVGVKVKQEKPEPVVLGSDRSTTRGAGQIVSPATATSEAIRRPLMSGHCAHPATNADSHKRCAGFTRANPDKIFQPCPCTCHFPEARYECGNCGATIVAAPHWPSDEDGDTRYLHVDPTRPRIVAEECPR